VYDPEAMENSRRVLGESVSFAENQYECLEGADALVIATEWNEFRTPDFSKIESVMRTKSIFDGRNLFDSATIGQLGFHYESIGRSAQEANKN